MIRNICCGSGERAGKEKQERLSSGRSVEKVVGGFRYHGQDQAGEGGDLGGGDPAEDERAEGEAVGEPQPAGSDAHQGEICLSRIRILFKWKIERRV